jgi:hypothetical protein
LPAFCIYAASIVPSSEFESNEPLHHLAMVEVGAHPTISEACIILVSHFPLRPAKKWIVGALMIQKRGLFVAYFCINLALRRSSDAD